MKYQTLMEKKLKEYSGIKKPTKRSKTKKGAPINPTKCIDYYVR